MRKGSLKLLLSMALLAIGTTVYAASPVLSQLPTVVISDYENNGTQDWNLFVFTDAFAFADYVTDADTAVGNLKWTFMIGTGGTGDLTINDIDPLTDIADALNPSTPINGSSTTATFREVALSPGSGTDNGPYSTPTPITPSMGQDADINGDGTDDTLVGELVITLLVADDQGTSDGLDSGDTFVWTYDTDLVTTPVEDSLINPGMDFVDQPLAIGTDDPVGPGSPDWYFRDWTDTAGGSTLSQNWLNDCTSGTTGTPSPYDSFTITGAGDPDKIGSIGGAALGEWLAPGSAQSLLAPGKVYSVRATIGLNAAKTAGDAPRIGIQENTNANINQTYVINAPTTVAGIGDSPFLPAAGSSRQFINTVDPIDLDVAANSSTGETDDLYYLFNFDFINIIEIATLTASLTGYEVGSSDGVGYNQNAVQVTNGRYGAGFNEFDDWSQLQGGPIPLKGGGSVLTDVTSATPVAASVTIVTPNTSDGSSNAAFVEMTNFGGPGNIDDLEVTGGAIYRADYSISMDGGTAAGLSPGNTYGIAGLRLRTATPIPSFSIEFIVTPRNTNAFPTEGTASVLPLYWTASTQFTAGSSLGEENDAQMVFGVLDFEYTDCTAILSALRVYELSNDDPNIDY